MTEETVKIENECGQVSYTFEPYPGGDYVHIHNLFIKPDQRRKGEATKLIQMAINEIREKGWPHEIQIVAKPTEQSVNKAELVKFYERMGLEVFDEYL